METCDAYLGCLRKSLTEALASKERHPDLKKALNKMRARPFWNWGDSFLALSGHVLGFSAEKPSLKQLQNGACFREAKIPDPYALAEEGVLWAALGVIENKKELCQAAVKLANWQLHLLDHRYFPFQGIWTKSAHLPEILAYHSLLFSMAFAFSGEERFQRAAAGIRPHLQGIEIPELPRQISRFLHDRKVSQEKYHLSPFLEEMVLGMTKASGPNWSAVAAVSGINTGMGAFHKNESAVVTFGPQMRPLDDLTSFGIERVCSFKERTFSDLVWEKTVQGFLLKGWTKVFAQPLWIESTFRVQNGEMKIEITKEEGKEWENLYFTFFVRSEEAAVGGKKLQPLSLERFKGEALKVIFKGLEIEGEGEVEVIPLAGGSHFWGADFLVAYALDPKKDSYQWVVK